MTILARGKGNKSKLDHLRIILILQLSRQYNNRNIHLLYIIKNIPDSTGLPQ